MVTLSLLGILAVGAAQGADTPASPEQLAIKVKNDRLTLALAKVPQVYLSGPIDPGAAQRFETLLRQGKIPDGADVYLDSPGGDIPTGIALGKLLRQAGMTTHVGAQRPPMRYGTGSTPKISQCADACAYAYLGGLYRWTPSGADRVGLHADAVPITATGAPSAAANAAERLAYLKSMDIEPAYLAKVLGPADGEGMVWFNAEQMYPWEVANNGRLPLKASVQLVNGAPLLTLSQTVRNGENRITLQCGPSGIELSAYYGVGGERAAKLVARAQRSYFELAHREIEPVQDGRAHVLSDAVNFARPLSLAQAQALLASDSLGAWLADRSGAVRYGFTIGPVAVATATQGFIPACAATQRGAAPAAR